MTVRYGTLEGDRDRLPTSSWVPCTALVGYQDQSCPPQPANEVFGLVDVVRIENIRSGHWLPRRCNPVSERPEFRRAQQRATLIISFTWSVHRGRLVHRLKLRGRQGLMLCSSQLRFKGGAMNHGEGACLIGMVLAMILLVEERYPILHRAWFRKLDIR